MNNSYSHSGFDNLYNRYFSPKEELILFGDNISNSQVCRRYDSINSSEITPLYSFQNLIRPLYGLGEAKPPSIGGHPEFEHLSGRLEQEYSAITTVFVDIESSTRLGIIYNLEEVQRIKNAFICTAIEIIRTFDGHVHRIMGDAVMSFFGSKNLAPEKSAILALNCVSVLQYFTKSHVIPRLNSEGFEDPFGIRIGVDFGPKNEVLWSSYGYQGMNEVTATSFFVDVASKLQSSAPRNGVMIGQSIRDLLDFPEELTSIKTIIKQGIQDLDCYINPNHTDKNGKKINYKKFILDWEKYISFQTISHINVTNNINYFDVYIEAYDRENGNFLYNVFPSTTLIDKNVWIKFCVKLKYQPMLPYKIKFRVENHGKEARLYTNNGNHQSYFEVDSQLKHNNIFHWEHTLYKGLHYMIVEVFTHGKLSHRKKIGIYVN